MTIKDVNGISQDGSYLPQKKTTSEIQKASLSGLKPMRRKLGLQMLTLFDDSYKFLSKMTHEYLDERYSQIKTVDDAYDESKIKLNELAIIYTPSTPLFMIENWLNGLLIYLNFENQREDYQMHQLAKYIYDELHFLNLPEITLFFRKVKKGKYGAFYGRIDPVEMIRWARDFRQERGNYIAKQPISYESEVLKKAKDEFVSGQI